MHGCRLRIETSARTCSFRWTGVATIHTTCHGSARYILQPNTALRRIGAVTDVFWGAGVQDERHSYEKCQYIEFKRRVAKMDELKAEKGGRSGLNWERIPAVPATNMRMNGSHGLCIVCIEILASEKVHRWTVDVCLSNLDIYSQHNGLQEWAM